MFRRQAGWYKDAVIYELHIRSFYDANDDGIGDFHGLTQKLDYLDDLGIDAVWLLPFYPSPLEDDGSDIRDYCDIHPDYGTMGDFIEFLEEAHRRDIKVISELVLNHTSEQHPWFQRARRAPKGSTERDYYIWSETPDKYEEARVVFPNQKDSNWSWDPVAEAYYWHRFFEHQPDLNFNNEAVREAIFEVCDFWFDKGVDGLRLDAIPYIFLEEGTICESLPQTHEYLRNLRSRIDKKYDNRMLLGEANQRPENAVEYFGDGDKCHMLFHFSLMPRLYLALHKADVEPIADIAEKTPEIPETCQWALFLRNHDELTLEKVTDEERYEMYERFAPDPEMRINLGIRRRLAPLLDGDIRQIRLLYSILFALKGTPVIYYGDEIGMGDNYFLGDRNSVRTPMQWDSGPNAGFSDATPNDLHLPVITDPNYHYKLINVENQQDRPHSLLMWLKELISMREQNPLLGRGDSRLLSSDNPSVLAVIRHNEEGEAILFTANLSDDMQYTELNLETFSNRRPRELFGGSKLPRADDGLELTLPPFGSYWLELLEPDSS